MNRIRKMGVKALVLPFVATLVIAIIFGCAFMPMLLMKASNVSFGIVTLDEGGTTVAGNSNLGDTIVENVVKGDGLSAMSGSSSSSNSSTMVGSIKWKVYETQDQLMDAIDDGTVYGGMVIPKDFTSQQMLHATGLGNAPVLKVYLNQAKNPMMVTMMQPTLTNMMNKNGMCVDVEILNPVDLGGSGSMSSTMAVMILVFPLLIMSLLGGILSSLVLWPKEGTRRQKGIAACKQLAFVLVFAAFAVLIDVCIDLVAGLDLPLGNLLPFLYVAALAMMIPFAALADVKLPLSYVLMVILMMCGQGTIMYTSDMLPEPWASYICPWVPQANIGNGLRSILYMGNGPFDTNMVPFICWIAGGLVVLAIAVFATKKHRDDKVKTA